MLANLGVGWLGREPWDPPPFVWLQGAVALSALYMTALILATQRREDELAGHREQLTLELAILGEQKSAKIIQLLERIRCDDPSLANRVDHEAAAMSVVLFLIILAVSVAQFTYFNKRTTYEIA